MYVSLSDPALETLEDLSLTPDMALQLSQWAAALVSDPSVPCTADSVAQSIRCLMDQTDPLPGITIEDALDRVLALLRCAACVSVLSRRLSWQPALVSGMSYLLTKVRASLSALPTAAVAPESIANVNAAPSRG